MSDDPKLRVDTLGLHDADGEVMRLHVMDGQLIDRRCPCGAGRYVFGWATDGDGKPIGGLPMLLHTEPPCAPFVRLSFSDVFRYLRTGEDVESAPIMPSEAKPEKPRKAHHR